jgi:hypothetical protein
MLQFPTESQQLVGAAQLTALRNALYNMRFFGLEMTIRTG